MNKTNVLLIGSGGREHAIAWKLAQSPLLNKLYIAPGNAGTSHVGTNVPLNGNDFESIKSFVVTNRIDMVVVGPEEPLVKGIHDFFLADNALKNIPVIGPQKAGAELEGSKDFAKQFMIRHGIPTGAYQTFTKETLTEGLAFLKTLQAPFVLKADGLAAGKQKKGLIHQAPLLCHFRNPCVWQELFPLANLKLALNIFVLVI